MRWRKKTLWLCILMIIPLFATLTMIRVVKASPIKMSMDPQSIMGTTWVPGTQFSIDIVVDFVWDLWSYQFELSFNPEVLHGVSVENGPFLGSAGGSVAATPGSGFDNDTGTLSLFGAILFPKANFPTGGSAQLGPLATVTFEVVGTGFSNISFGLETGLLNRDGDWDFDGEWCYGYIWEPIGMGGEWVPYPEWLTDCHGSFDNRAVIHVDPEQVKGTQINETFSINVNVLNITDLYSWEFSMSWNATLLNATDIIEGGLLKSQRDTSFGPAEINNVAGELTIDCTTIEANTGVDGSGTLANVTFSVKSRGKGTLHLYATKLFDSRGNPIANRTSDGYFTNLKTHDLTISNFALYPTEVEAGSGDPIFINVTVMNIGDHNEADVEVSVYYGENEVNATNVPSLEIDTSETLTFIWNTTGVSRGKYLIWAAASSEDVTTEYTYGLVTISAHDIAITSVTTPVINVFSGLNTTVTVIVRSLGTELETFNVTVYYNETAIGTETVSDFGYLATKTLKFTWDTTGVELGNYTISAKATVVEGEENTDDNIFIIDKLINVIPFEDQPFPTELFILVVSVVVIVGLTVLFYWRRRRSAEAREELITPF